MKKRRRRSLQTSAVVIERGDSRTSPDGCKSGGFGETKTEVITTANQKKDNILRANENSE